MATLIGQLGLDKPLVVGHSLGGAVALALALDHPELVGGLALVAPLTQPQSHVPDVFRPLAVRSRLMRFLLAWTLATPGAIRNGKKAMQVVFGPDKVPPNYATSGGGLLGLRPLAFFHTSSDLVAAGDDMPRYAKRYGELERAGRGAVRHGRPNPGSHSACKPVQPSICRACTWS